jgi:hypothetical protein
MSLGVLAVLALFPLGVLRTQQAVLDTRATILAKAVQATIELNGWPDDVFLRRPPADPDPLYPNSDRAAPALLEDGNVFRTIPNADGSIQLQFPVGSSRPAFPVLVDPVLRCADVFQYDDKSDAAILINYKRVAIRASLIDDNGAVYTTMDPFDATLTGTAVLYDLPVHTLSDVQWMSPDPPPPTSVRSVLQGDRREAYLRRWFFSPDDLLYEASNHVIPRNPHGQTVAPEPWEYFQYFPDTPGVDPSLPLDMHSTSSRNPTFSWAFALVGRSLQPHAESGLVPAQYAASQLRIMIFRNRSLSDPYRLVRGCFFNNSTTVTLSWPTTTTRPEIKRGTWLMEYTVSGTDRMDTLHRLALIFHRVAGFKDPELIGGQWHQVVSLQNTVTDAGLPSHPMNDLRALPDDYPNTASPRTFDEAAAVFMTDKDGGVDLNGDGDTADPGEGIAKIWVPVIVWDGLIEVFTGR